tara:strand:+ start:349 stop:609 length:261 start_codon:yes stop_codon:yes gene_type:complete
MSDREIINAKQGLPMWWKPGIAFLKEEWLNNEFLSHFKNKKSTERNCSCDSPKLVELWEHDSCIRGRIDTTVCIKCNEVKSFSIVR